MAYGVVIVAGGSRADDLMSTSYVDVYERVGMPATFTLRYGVFNVEGDLEPLKEPRFAPGAEIAVFQRGNDLNECLVKGQVYSHKIKLIHGVGGSYLDVIGADNTLQMDRETKLTQWADNTTDADAATSIISSYGFTPEVESTNTRHLEAKRTLIQHDTDLNMVRKLARRNGYLFWVRSDADLVETAYFRSPPLDDPEPIELNVNLDTYNLDSVDIEWDVERPTSVLANAYDGGAKEVIDASSVPPPPGFNGDLALAAIAGAARSTSVVAAVTDAGDLMGRATGVLMESSWFIQASCRASVRRIGRVVRAHSVAKLDGAGKRYSGMYFVTSVRHMIDEGDHIMEITMVRTGWME